MVVQAPCGPSAIGGRGKNTVGPTEATLLGLNQAPLSPEQIGEVLAQQRGGAFQVQATGPTRGLGTCCSVWALLLQGVWADPLGLGVLLQWEGSACLL